METQALFNHESEEFKILLSDGIPTIIISDADGDQACFSVHNHKQVSIIQNFLFQIQDQLRAKEKAGEDLPKVNNTQREEGWKPKVPKLTPSIDVGLNKEKTTK